MSRYYFKRIDEPKGEQVAPFAVFGVMTQGHERLMNTSEQRYEGVVVPVAEEVGLSDRLLPGGLLKKGTYDELGATGEEDTPVNEEGYNTLVRWNKKTAIAQLAWVSEQTAIVVYKFGGTLTLANPELEGVEWPSMDWNADEDCVQQRAQFLARYISRYDLGKMHDAALLHFVGQSLPPGQLGNSPTPSKQISNGAQTASPPTTAQPALVVNGSPASAI